MQLDKFTRRYIHMGNNIPKTSNSVKRSDSNSKTTDNNIKHTFNLQSSGTKPYNTENVLKVPDKKKTK